MDESAFAEEHPGALKHTETPDEIFHRTWLQELVQRAFRRLLKEAQILTCLFVSGKAGRGACPVSRDRLRSTSP